MDNNYNIYFKYDRCLYVLYLYFMKQGAVDAINGYIVVIGGVGTSGTRQQLLNQVIYKYNKLN